MFTQRFSSLTTSHSAHLAPHLCREISHRNGNQKTKTDWLEGRKRQALLWLITFAKEGETKWKDVVFARWDTEAIDVSQRLMAQPLKGRIHLALLLAHGHHWNCIILILSSVSQPCSTRLVIHELYIACCPRVYSLPPSI